MSKYIKLLSLFFVCAYFLNYISTYKDWHFIDNVNLIFHEAGHTIFFFLGHFLSVLAGSGFQVALPIFFSIYFFAKQQKISGSLCLLWVGQNLLNVSIYAGDAINMNLDLLGGDSVIHDWNYLLDTVGILKYTGTIASMIYFLGIINISLGSVFSIYYSWIEDSNPQEIFTK